MANDLLVQVLIACRAENDFSLEYVAKEIGLTKGGLSNIERGVSRPRRTTRYQLMTFLRRYGYEVREEEIA